jgi:hypothetical protein
MDAYVVVRNGSELVRTVQQWMNSSALGDRHYDIRSGCQIQINLVTLEEVR